MKTEIIKTKKGQIEYSILGEGIPIIFIHGGHSNCKETLCLKGFDLDRYQLIIPSRPGYGNTPLSNKTTPKKSAELIISLLDYLKIDKVVLYAVSAGGLTAIEIAANYNQRVEKFILASAVSKKWFDENDKIYKTAKKIFNPKIEAYLWGLIRLISRVFPRMIGNSFYPQFSSKKPHRLDRDDINELLLLFRNFNSKEGFMSDINHNIEKDLITRINCPTLVIHSEYDTSVPYSHAVHSNKMINGAKLVSLKNEWGHIFWIGKDSNESIRKTIEFIEHNNYEKTKQ